MNSHFTDGRDDGANKQTAIKDEQNNESVFKATVLIIVKGKNKIDQSIFDIVANARFDNM